MSFFKSTPAEPVDEHLAPLLIDDSAYQRKVLVKFQSSVSHWAAGSGEGIEVLSGFDGGDHLLVITNRSVCQFSKFMKYGLWKRLPYAEIPDRGVGIHGHKCNETLKYINVESDRARRFSEQDERRINYVITGTVATDKALAIAEALMAHTDRYARLLAEKYASIVVAAEARAETVHPATRDRRSVRTYSSDRGQPPQGWCRQASGFGVVPRKPEFQGRCDGRHRSQEGV